jgi:hypothetical protein
MRTAISLTAGLFLLAGLLTAAGLTGAWKGQFDFNGNAVPLTIDLKADGDALTGSVTGLPAGPSDIKDGKIQGAAVSFSLMTQYQGDPVKLVYKGQVQGDEIHFSMGLEDGTWSVVFVAKRGPQTTP